MSANPAAIMSPAASPEAHHSPRPNLSSKPNIGTIVIFVALMVGGLIYITKSLVADVNDTGAASHMTTLLPFVLLGIALLIALGFEFVNGFHDTANAVATVIYTHSLPPNFAVIWSGTFNFLGVLTSSGAVAFTVITLLPVELILQVGSGAGFAMVFALLIAAIMWNLGTWWLGLPASSSHTMIGSIIGVGVANALMHGRDGTSGVDWGQVTNVGKALLLSPVVGFVCAALLFMLMRALVKKPELYQEPKGNAPPPLWIRGLLILTCTGVSFFHGSNDGQKGMGLIMLILVGTVPMAYALNRSMPADEITRFVALAEATKQSLVKAAPAPAPTTMEAARTGLSTYVRTKQAAPDTLPSLAFVTGNIATEVKGGTLAHVPAEQVANVRNDMYLSSETIRFLQKDTAVKLDADTQDKLKAYKTEIDKATRFIPVWVKVAVAIALGLGTMVGWKRIVVTVGEKIGKTHMNYAQGASAELVAMATIGAADAFGLPVSTTHVLSSGVAGAMTASGSGLQLSTLRNIAMAWILTLPVAMLLSGSLYWVLTQITN